MTNPQIIFIRAKFKTTRGWNDLKIAFPLIEPALQALPDETLIGRINPLLFDMYDDAKKQAMQLIP